MKKVQILLSTYNGERYLEEQIESLKKQAGVEISILVRDDGSKDATKEMLAKWQDEGVLKWYDGENLRPCKSFMNLVKNAPEADYYAFCDQDDVWDEEKLIQAVSKLEKAEIPSMYFSKAQLVDENLLPIKSSRYPKGAYTFGEALIKNNCTGCTVVFNRKLLELVRTYEPEFITMHDYWVYLVCLSVGGTVIYDSNSYIKYRQHSHNVVGGKRRIVKEYTDKFNMLVSKSKIRSKIAEELKRGYYDQMPKHNQVIVDKVINYHSSVKAKWELIADKDIKTDTFFNNALFAVAVIFGAF